MSEEHGSTRYELPRLRNEVEEAMLRLYDLAQQWDGTDMEPRLWEVAQSLFAAKTHITTEMDRLNVSVRSVGLG